MTCKQRLRGNEEVSMHVGLGWGWGDSQMGISLVSSRNGKEARKLEKTE